MSEYQITNQLVLAAKQYIKGSTMILDEDRLWRRVQEEIDASPSQTMLMAKHRGKKKGGKDPLFSQDDGFLARLNVCLSLQKQYRDMLRSLRDSLGGSHSLSIPFTVHSTFNLTPSTLQPGGVKRSVVTNSTFNLLTPSVTGSPVRLTLSQSKLGLKCLNFIVKELEI